MALSPESRRGLREAFPWRRHQVPSQQETGRPSLSSGYGYLSNSGYEYLPASSRRRESKQTYLSTYEDREEQKQTYIQRWFASSKGDITTRREEKLRQKSAESSAWDFWPTVDVISWWSWLWSATAGCLHVALNVTLAQDIARHDARLSLSDATSQRKVVFKKPPDRHLVDVDVSLRHQVLQRTTNWSVWRLSPRGPAAASALYPPIPVVDKMRIQSPSRKLRLMSLYGATALTALLRASLEAWDLVSAPSFEALSYTWLGPFDGDNLHDDEIEINGHVLDITGNLGHALRRLRYRGNGRVLWVDAICINQFDVQERGHQVTIMSEIYNAAKQVLVWLGEDSDSRTGHLCSRYAEIKQTKVPGILGAIGYRSSSIPLGGEDTSAVVG